MSDLTPTTGEPSNCDMITFGKYAGKTYQEVMMEDSLYCNWVIATVDQKHEESNPAMIRFAHYLVQKEHEMIHYENLRQFADDMDML